KLSTSRRSRPTCGARSSTGSVLESDTAGQAGRCCHSANGTGSRMVALPFSLNSGIDSLLEGLGADAPVGVDEALAVAAIVEVGGDQGVNRLDHLVGGHGRTQDRADRRLAEVDVTAKADLVELDPVLIDAQDADVADVMMAAGVDAARDLDLQVADVVLAGERGAAGW